MTDLQGLLTHLIRAKVKFIIIGGYAAMAHGSSLLTRDVDICCEMSRENLFRLQCALGSINPVHRMGSERIPLSITEENAEGINNLYLQTDLGQLDCLGHVQGVGDYNEMIKGTIEVKLDCGPCRIADLETLIRTKKSLNRDKDKEALLQLRAIRKRLREEAD